MTAQPCGALMPPLHDAGWECNGTGLIIVTMWRRISAPDLPIVLPRRALEIIDPEPWWDTPTRDFTGGDHVHLCVPRRPTTFQGDSTLVFGSTAMRFKFIGISDGGPMHVALSPERLRHDL
jgi:hypothetical protein